MMSAGSTPSSSVIAGLTKVQIPCPSMTMVVSDECWMRERNRSSLRRIDDSASSFCSIVAPAMRMMNTRMNAPMAASALARDTDSSEGAHPSEMAN